MTSRFHTNKTFTVNWFINYAELDKFNYVEFTYYKVGKLLLQTKQLLQYEATLVQIGITKLGKHYYKVGHLHFIKKWG